MVMYPSLSMATMAVDASDSDSGIAVLIHTITLLFTYGNL
jgi:hypothetical protein